MFCFFVLGLFILLPLRRNLVWLDIPAQHLPNDNDNKNNNNNNKNNNNKNNNNNINQLD